MDNPGAKRVVLGLLGTRLDADTRPDRWCSWRPSVAVCQQENLLVHRFELLHGPKEEKLARLVADDIASVSPETDVRTHPLVTKDPWDFEEVYAALHDFARAYPFNTEAEEYLVNITTGTHVAQICLFLLTESRHLPGKLLQCSPPARRHQQDPIGSYRIIDLDLSRYDRLASRFALDRKKATSFLKSGIETRNVEFNRLIDRIERVVIASSAPVLLTGPTGAGKSQLGATHLSTQASAAADCRPVCRSQLCYGSRRSGHVCTVRPCERRVHGRHDRSSWPAASGRRRDAVPRRNWRTGD